MYEVVFLDLDGTITDSKPGVLTSVKYALRKMGKPIPSEAELNNFIGPPLVDSFEKYCGMNNEEANRATDIYREYYVGQDGLFDAVVYDGVEEMLKTLNAAGKRVIVATAKPEEMAQSVLAHFKLTQYFEYIAGASMDETRNNKTAVIKYALEIGDITDLSQVVMVGDRHHDMEGAAANGIGSIGVLYGYGDEAELIGSGAGTLAATPQEAAAIIMG